MKYLLLLSILFYPGFSYSGPCNYPDDLDSAGRRCGKRAASVRPGGRLGGDGTLSGSQTRPALNNQDTNPSDNSDQYNNQDNNLFRDYQSLE